MMSTTGRMPVMAAPTPMPAYAGLGDRRVDDALGAEFLHQPDKHFERRARLGDVFADDEHRGSRRISSASASLIAWLKVISRVAVCAFAMTLSVDMLLDFVRIGILGVERELDRRFHFLRQFTVRSSASALPSAILFFRSQSASSLIGSRRVFHSSSSALDR